MERFDILNVKQDQLELSLQGQCQLGCSQTDLLILGSIFCSWYSTAVMDWLIQDKYRHFRESILYLYCISLVCFWVCWLNNVVHQQVIDLYVYVCWFLITIVTCGFAMSHKTQTNDTRAELAELVKRKEEIAVSEMNFDTVFVVFLYMRFCIMNFYIMNAWHKQGFVFFCKWRA